MLEKIKFSIIPITLAATLFIFSSQALAVEVPKTATPPGKLKACQVRESAIKTRMAHLTALVTNVIAKFDKHAASVEKYYTDKVVPSGKKVYNYDSLVSDINNKKTAVFSVLTKAQNDVNSFSCSNADPKLAMTQFRKDMQDVKKALKNYRTSIKNLIVAIRSVTGSEKSATGGGENK